MPKWLSLFFAAFSVLLMTATAIAIPHSGWLAALFFLLSMTSITIGFIVGAKMKRRNQG